MIFPTRLPKKRFRRCLHCGELFLSASSAERVCPKHRRKHNKLLARYGGADIIESTPDISEHLTRLKENSECSCVLCDEDIDVFLAGGDIDDSPVYRALRMIKHRAAQPQKKVAAAFSLDDIIKAAKEKPGKLDIFM